MMCLVTMVTLCLVTMRDLSTLYSVTRMDLSTLFVTRMDLSTDYQDGFN